MTRRLSKPEKTSCLSHPLSHDNSVPEAAAPGPPRAPPTLMFTVQSKTQHLPLPGPLLEGGRTHCPTPRRGPVSQTGNPTPEAGRKHAELAGSLGSAVSKGSSLSLPLGGSAALTWGAARSQDPISEVGSPREERRVWCPQEERAGEWRAGRRLLGKSRPGKRNESAPGNAANEGGGGTGALAGAPGQSLTCLLHG